MSDDKWKEEFVIDEGSEIGIPDRVEHLVILIERFDKNQILIKHSGDVNVGQYDVVHGKHLSPQDSFSVFFDKISPESFTLSDIKIFIDMHMACESQVSFEEWFFEQNDRGTRQGIIAHQIGVHPPAKEAQS